MKVSIIISQNCAENRAKDIIHLSRSLKEQFDIGTQKAQLNTVRSFGLVPGQKLDRILDHFSKLSYDLEGTASWHLFLGVLNQTVKDLCKHRKVLWVKPQVIANEWKDTIAKSRTRALLNSLYDSLDDKSSLTFLTFKHCSAQGCDSIGTDIFIIKVFCKLVDDIRMVLLANKFLQDAHLHNLDVGGLSARK